MTWLPQGIAKYFTREIAPPPKPQQTPYEMGFSGPAADMAKYFLSLEMQKGARDALRQGRPENMTALLNDLGPFSVVRLLTGAMVAHERGQIVSGALGDLTGEELKIAVAPLAPQKKREVLGETLVHAAKTGKMEQVDALVAAGADVNYNGGEPLRSVWGGNNFEMAAKLVNAGADTTFALEAAVFAARAKALSRPFS